MTARSSLEEMLDSLRRRDEREKPKDLPPALPVRPTSRARLPPARRSLPTNFKVGEGGGDGSAPTECNGKEEGKRKEIDLGFKRGSFGSKKLKKDQNVESPYAVQAEEGKNVLTEGVDSDSKSVVMRASQLKRRELDWDDSFGYFIKKKPLAPRLLDILPHKIIFRPFDRGRKKIMMEGIPSTMKTGVWYERVPGVYHCGYPSQKSYGSASYLIVHPEGNILIDNSRYVERLASNIDEAGVSGATLQAVNLSDGIKLNQNSCRKVFKWAVRLAVLVNDAKVVHFLHVGVIHGSFDNGLKTNNILINEHWVARLSDNGMSIILEGSDKFETKGIKNWGAARKMFDEILKRGNRIKVIKAIPILGLFFGGMVLNQFGLFGNLTDVKVLPKWDISLLFENGLELSLARLKALAKLILRRIWSTAEALMME